MSTFQGEAEATRAISRYGIPMGAQLAGLKFGGPRGEAIGGAAGEWVVHRLDMVDEEKSLGEEARDVTMAGLLPAAFRKGAKTVGAAINWGRRAMFRMAPGSAEWLHSQAIVAIESKVGEMKAVLGEVGKAWDDAARLGTGVRIPVKHVQATVKKLRNNEKLLETLGAQARATLLKRMDKLDKGLQGFDTHNINHLNMLRQRYGEFIGAAAKRGGPEYGAYKKIQRSIYEALEEAASHPATTLDQPAVTALNNAIGTTKQVAGYTEFESVLKGAISQTDEGALIIKPKALLEGLRKNDDIVRNLGKDQVAQLRSFILGLHRMTPKLTKIGAGHLILHGLVAGAGGVAGYQLGESAGMGPLGAGMLGLAGGVTGSLLTTVVLHEFSDSIARMMLSPKGQEQLAAIWANSQGGRFTGDKIAQVIQAGRIISLGDLNPVPVLGKTAMGHQPTSKGNEPKSRSALEAIFELKAGK